MNPTTIVIVLLAVTLAVVVFLLLRVVSRTRDLEKEVSRLESSFSAMTRKSPRDEEDFSTHDESATIQAPIQKNID